MEFVRNAGRAFSPLDKELELLNGELTPRLQESVVRLSTWMPFGRAAKELRYFTRVEVSEATARRITEGAGSHYVGVQNEQVEHILKQAPPSPPGPQVQLISADGAMVHEVTGEWVEVKTVAIGEVEAKGDAGEVHTRELSYFSRLSEASEFNRQALVEVFRRGAEKAGKVCAVNDGAEWEQKFIDYHRPDAVRILDFAHAAGKVAEPGRLIFGEETAEFKDWFNKQKHSLKLGKTEAVLRNIRGLENRARGQGRAKKLKVIQGSVNYLEKRREMINYDEFQGLGYPIGSGCVESANKLVVESRLKQAGMRWARQNIDPMLGLRNIACNDRWEEAWPQLVNHKLGATTESRRQRRALKSLEQLQATDIASAQAAPTRAQLQNSENPAEEKLANARAKTPYKPAADHPWRRKVFGRARYSMPEAFSRAKS
jgi:hypothetical protein